VPLVLAVLVVHHDDELAGRDVADRLLDGREGAPVGAPAWLLDAAHRRSSLPPNPCRARCSRVTRAALSRSASRALRYSTTYRPIMSTSRLTGVPGACSPRQVASRVSDTSATSKARGWRAATV